MFSQYFGNYLLHNKQITEAQLQLALEYQDKNRAKLGLIAVNEGLLTEKQADELNLLQAREDKRLGDLAIEKGYLSETDISNLLRLQGNPYLTFIQALAETKALSTADAEVIVSSFQKEYHLSNSQLTAIKNAEIDEVVSTFVDSSDKVHLDFISLALRNITRFVTPHFRIENADHLSSYSAQYIAIQKTNGDHHGFLGFASDDDSLLLVANGFAKGVTKESFTEMNDDSFDSICEFINCINGLFATHLCSERSIEIDMCPPDFYVNKTLNASGDILVVPTYIQGKRIDILTGIRSEAKFD